jgi:hypothetical protein
MSAETPPIDSPRSPELLADQRFQPIELPDLEQTSVVSIDWLWDGYLARRNVTLMISQWKAGKTTLLSVLLARMGAGGVLAGLEVRPARALVLSEEDASLWIGRQRDLQIGRHVRMLCRPFPAAPHETDWKQLVEFVSAEIRTGAVDLVVVDTLAKFLPGNEGDAAAVQRFIGSLQGLAQLGAAVLVLHHPKKGSFKLGQAARGSGALSASADVIVEMGWLSLPDDADRRRLLRGFSRHGATPRRLAIELSADGHDYAAVAASAVDDFETCWPVLQGVLEDAHQKHTRKGIIQAWPQDHPKPSDVTLWRWLERALGEGRVQRDGAGRSRKPFRYWLTGQEERWKHDPDHLPELPEFDDFDLIRAAGNVLHNSELINEARHEKRKRKKKKREAPREEPIEVRDERPCYPFGEEARRIEEEGRYAPPRRGE